MAETKKKKKASDVGRFGKPAALSVYPYSKVRKDSQVVPKSGIF
jgi:hypothetical protein